MTDTISHPRIRYQEKADPEFANEIAAMVGGDELLSCIQCGTCSGVCPVSPYMDYTPRQVIALTKAGLKEEVLSCKTIWLCASCYACTTACPKQIKVTDVMYALKRKAIQAGHYPKRFPIPVLANEFYRAVESSGRSSEGRLIVRLYAKTNPFGLFGKMRLGMGLLRTGRFSLKREKTANPSDVRDLLNSVEAGGK
ncbi:MAG TPA: 4Fe-4S dicluster domain-containing protein [Fimbriimonadaceae bacterium]|nr:4Fe-4S dicluster domain-containing protein [Fimbriimonadaceae bacterium]